MGIITNFLNGVVHQNLTNAQVQPNISKDEIWKFSIGPKGHFRKLRFWTMREIPNQNPQMLDDNPNTQEDGIWKFA